MKAKEFEIKKRDPNWRAMQDIRRSGAGGQHKDKKKAAKQGEVKHKAKMGEDHGPEDPEAVYNVGEYDREGDMAKDQLRTINDAAKELYKMITPEENLPEWVQSKITKALDYLDTARDYMKANKYAEDLEEEKQKGLDGKACWKGYRRMGTKMKGGKRVDNCVKVKEDEGEGKYKGIDDKNGTRFADWMMYHGNGLADDWHTESEGYDLIKIADDFEKRKIDFKQAQDRIFDLFKQGHDVRASFIKNFAPNKLKNPPDEWNSSWFEDIGIDEQGRRDYGYDDFGNSLRPGDDEGSTEPPNNFAIYINGKKWKVFQGKGQYADDQYEMQQFRQLQAMAQRKSQETGKKWEVSRTLEPATK